MEPNRLLYQDSSSVPCKPARTIFRFSGVRPSLAAALNVIPDSIASTSASLPAGPRAAYREPHPGPPCLGVRTASVLEGPDALSAVHKVCGRVS